MVKHLSTFSDVCVLGEWQTVNDGHYLLGVYKEIELAVDEKSCFSFKLTLKYHSVQFTDEEWVLCETWLKYITLASFSCFCPTSRFHCCPAHVAVDGV